MSIALRKSARQIDRSTKSMNTTIRTSILVGLLALAFGLLAPTFTRFLLDAPAAFVMTLAGLAMLRILQTAFTTCFGGKFTLGSLVAFLVTVADLPIFNIGAAFWGLVAGAIATLVFKHGKQQA